ncbi:MAG: hypothetical protein KF819_18015 [Labilithrix sp.]|nr:hypothetical protein [Labilithrix sp.]
MLRRLSLRASFVLGAAWISLAGCSGTATGVGTGAEVGAGSGEAAPPSSSNGPVAVDFEALFGAPATTSITDDVVTGLWGGNAGPHDVRIKIGTSSMTIAVKCASSGAVGAELAANVSIDAIRILSSKEVRASQQCYFDLRPRTIPRCAPDVDDECFRISGTTLRLRGTQLFVVSSQTGSAGLDDTLTKLSD